MTNLNARNYIRKRGAHHRTTTDPQTRHWEA